MLRAVLLLLVAAVCAPAQQTLEQRLLASKLLEESGDLPGAAAEAEAALALDSSHEPARLQLGRLFLTGNNPEAAREVFAGGLETAPDSKLLRLGVGLSLNQLRRYEESFPLMEQLAADAPELSLAADAFVEAALELQRYDAARAAMEGTLKALPGDYRSYYRLALIGDRSRSASPEEIEELLRKAIALEAKFAPPYSLLGKTLLQLDRPQEAALMLESGLRLDPSDRTARIQLARAYRVLGRPDDAKREAEVLRKMQDERPEDPGVLRRRSDSDAQKKRALE